MSGRYRYRLAGVSAVDVRRDTLGECAGAFEDLVNKLDDDGWEPVMSVHLTDAKGRQARYLLVRDKKGGA